LSEDENIVGIGLENIGSLEHRFILFYIRKSQKDALIQIPKCPICSLLGCDFNQLVSPARDD